jgi:hypothetical protein
MPAFDLRIPLLILQMPLLGLTITMPALAMPWCVGGLGLGAQGSAEVATGGVFHDFSSPLTYGDSELVEGGPSFSIYDRQYDAPVPGTGKNPPQVNSIGQPSGDRTPCSNNFSVPSS